MEQLNDRRNVCYAPARQHETAAVFLSLWRFLRFQEVRLKPIAASVN